MSYISVISMLYDIVSYISRYTSKLVPVFPGCHRFAKALQWPLPLVRVGISLASRRVGGARFRNPRSQHTVINNAFRARLSIFCITINSRRALNARRISQNRTAPP
jgi:hypothetical protein